MAINRELTQFSNFIRVDDVTRNISIAGTEALNVGIGTLTPTAKLHVDGNSIITGISTFGSTNGIGTVTIGLGETSLYVDGSARITGNFLVGRGTVIIDGQNNRINVGSGVTVDGSNNRIIIGSGTTSPDIVIDGRTGIISATSIFIGVSSTPTTLGVTSATNLTSQTLNVSGISTLGVTSATNLTSQTVSVSGVSTLGITSATDLTAQTLNVSGISTLGVTSATDLTVQTLSVSGVSTLGVTSATDLTSQTLNVSGISTLGVTTITELTAQTLNVSGILTASNLKYPTGDGKRGQTIVTDGNGLLTFGDSGLGLFKNRFYVSATSGNDANDGKILPVRTIKKAAQLASLQGGQIAIFVESGDYLEDNPIILYDDVSIIGDNIRNTYVRPANAGRDMFRVRNGCYLTGFTIRDRLVDGVPQNTFDNAWAFDDPKDTNTSRVGYAGTQVDITGVQYSHTLGIATITTATPHSFKNLGSTVRLSGIGFTCTSDNGATTLIYPESNKSKIEDFPIISIGSSTQLTVRTGISTIQHFYAGGGTLRIGKPLITRSPYIQNCSVISFLGGNGILVDGDKVLSPNIPPIQNEAENPSVGGTPEQGKSIVANAFTLTSFGGVGFRAINDGYAQLVSCFQIFCQDGSLCESGGYLSITNSATNFGTNALRSVGYSSKSFRFDRGVISLNSVVDGKQSLKIVGLGGGNQNNYILRFYNKNLEDRTGSFKNVGYTTSFDGITGINTNTNEITLPAHGLINRDTITYVSDSSGSIGGLINQREYYVNYVGINTVKLFEDSSLTKVVDLTGTAAGIHTLNKTNHEFFVDTISSTHNNYQELTLNSSSYTFVPGRLVTQTSTNASGYAVTFTSDKLLVSKETAVDFNTVGTIQDHSGTPQTASVTGVVGISTYYTIDVIVGSTQTSEIVQNISALPENYFCHLHRPSVINSSSHTWEYAGSGNDYNALPQNGGVADSTKEQVSERGGRVYTSGTNELGDFKVGDAITAFNRTGDIIFNNTVTIGELTSLKFKIGNSPEITGVSADIGLGDNDPGGPQDYRLTTQKAQRTFLNNRLGAFIDKTASTSSVPNAVVILNSSGQINSELIPVARESNNYISTESNARLSLVDDVPAKDLLAGDIVVEDTGITTTTYRLSNDRDSQYLVLSDSTRNYNFTNGEQIVSTNNNSAIGIVTAPHNVGYGNTGLVKGVLTLSTIVSGGSGYTQGVYKNVSIASSTGIGTSARADVTVNASGQITDVDFKFGGRNYVVNDVLRVTTVPISGTDYATVNVNAVETRLYTKLTNNTKFSASITSPDFISDNDAIGLSTDVSVGYSTSFDSLNDIDTVNNRIIVGVNTFSNGDPVVYNIGGGSIIGGLTNNQTYYIKRIGITSVELYSNYGLVNILDLTSSGTGTHSLTRVGINTSSNFITLTNHGYSTGDAVRVVGVGLPSGLTSGNYYFVGSVVTNAFTLHALRSDAFASINGLLVNAVSLGTTGSGIVTFTKQNVQYNRVVNTSSTSASNYSVISSENIDASNIISGTISPTRLGSGSATIDTFLSGNSTYQKVIKGVGIGTAEPITATGTSFDAAPGGVGVNTYYGNVNLTLNRVNGNLGDATYTNIGVAKFKKSTFSVGTDGEIQIKSSSAGGDVDAQTLDGQDGAYYLNPSNLTSAVPINKGGTNLTATPTTGTVLVGNGVGYDLTNNPNISGNLTAVSLGSINLNVSGVSTLGVTSTTNLTSQQLNVSGITTLGVTSTTNLTSQTLDVSGIGTITTLNSTSGSITNLSGTIGTITTLNSTSGSITNLSGTIGTITTLNSTSGTITNLSGTIGTITTLNSTSGTITNLNISGVSTLGTANVTTINRVTITQPATASTITVANGKTLTASNTLTFTGTDGSSVAFGTGGTVAYTSNKLSAFSATTSSELAGVISDETGTGSLVFATSPTLVTPVLGAATATSIVVGSATTITSSGINAPTGIATVSSIELGNASDTTISRVSAGRIAVEGINIVSVSSTDTLTNKTINLSNNTLTATSAQIASAVTDETGSGSLVFATSPTLVTPILGTPTSGTLTNCTGYTASNIASAGTGVTTFLVTPSSANLAAAVTDETGSGSLVFATSPQLTTPNIGSASGTALNISGVSTFTNGPVLVGSGTSTGTASQRLQVTGGGYVSGNLGIGTTNPTSPLHVVGNARIAGITTSSIFDSIDYLKTTQITEKVNIPTGIGTVAGGNYDLGSNGVVYFHTGVNGSNWTPNFRYNASTTLGSILTTGQSATVTIISTQGASATYSNSVQIDGNSSFTYGVQWSGGSAPTFGSSSGLDIYTYSLIRTGTGTNDWLVLASRTQYD